MWVLSGQCGRLTATEGLSEVSVGPSKTGIGAVNSWRGFLEPRDNRIRARAHTAMGAHRLFGGGPNDMMAPPDLPLGGHGPDGPPATATEIASLVRK